MDDVISIFSSPVITGDPRDPPPRVDLGVIEITDSEPEELDNGELFWTRLKNKNAIPNVSPYRNTHNSKEDSPMDVDVDLPTTQAGPSITLLVPDPFPEIPVIHIQPEVDPQTIQEPDADPYSKHLALVLEVIPDVLPTHAMDLIQMLYPTHKDQVAEVVLQDLFDNHSYPKAEKGVAGKGKRKASALEDVLERPPSRVKIDLASVDRPKPTGRNYRKLALVSCPSVNGTQSPRIRLTIHHTI
jgi:TRIAD3 protein (E3 ubiquitin-protein ligase RNF216)